MIIRTITCHNVYNYGASLQAFALQNFLESQGHEVEIINYMPTYLSVHYRLSTYISPGLYQYKPSLKHWYVRLPFILYRYLLSLKSIGRKFLFDSFTRKYLKLTPKYSTLESLCKNEQNADIYITGSDQVWNSYYMENGKDPAFYLTFVPNSKIKLSYAASFGAEAVDSNIASEIKGWLERFDKISVREQSGVDILKSFNIDSTVVCDPVFLLSKSDWFSFFKKKNNSKPYVLIYNIGQINHYLVSCACEIAKNKGLEVYSIYDKYEIENIDKNITNANPIDFVNYIAGSEFVISNSFHATAFSVIFHKQFFTFPFLSISNSSRMINLLNMVGLADRFVEKCPDPTLFGNIDYQSYTLKIDELSKIGKDWLLKSINNEK